MATFHFFVVKLSFMQDTFHGRKMSGKVTFNVQFQSMHLAIPGILMKKKTEYLCDIKISLAPEFKYLLY